MAYLTLADKSYLASIVEKAINQAKLDNPEPEIKYDRVKWNALVEYDPEIRTACEKVAPLGQKYIDQVAAAYLTLGDKSYLASIVEKAINQSKLDN